MNTTGESNSRGQGALKYELLLLLVSLIWGSAFVAQLIRMEKGLGPMTFNGLRFALGCLFLKLPVEVFERFEGVELGGFGTAGQHPLMPHVEFVLEDEFQELTVGEASGGGFL